MVFPLGMMMLAPGRTKAVVFPQGKPNFSEGGVRLPVSCGRLLDDGDVPEVDVKVLGAAVVQQVSVARAGAALNFRRSSSGCGGVTTVRAPPVASRRRDQHFPKVLNCLFSPGLRVHQPGQVDELEYEK